MGAQWANGIRFVSGMGFSTVSEFWQLGNLGTPDPSVPTMALDVPTNVVTLESSGSNYASGLSGTTYTDTSITVGSGSDRCLFVWLGINAGNPPNVSGVTWNGAAMTQVGSSAGASDQPLSLWRLVNPAVGNHSLVATLGSSVSGAQVVVLWANMLGVDQTTPAGTSVSDTDTGTNPVLTAAPTGDAAGYPLCGVIGWDSDAVMTFTSGGGQTRLATGPTDQQFTGCLDTEAPVGGAQSFGITGNTGAPYETTLIAVVALPATGTFATGLAFPALDYMKSRFQHLMVR